MSAHPAAVSRILGPRVAALALGLLAVTPAACAPPAPSLLSDPHQILAAAAAQARAAKAVHLEASIAGSVQLAGLVPGLPLGGAASTSAPLALTGTKATGDLDLAGSRASARLDVPALFGLTVDIRDVADKVYVRTSLTGAGWHAVDGAASTPLALSAWVERLEAVLVQPAASPTRLDDARCSTGTCYVVRLTTDATAFAPAAAAPSPRPAEARSIPLTLMLRIDQVTLRLTEVDVTADLASGGNVEATIGLGAWDAAVTVDAPAPGDIVQGPLLP